MRIDQTKADGGDEHRPPTRFDSGGKLLVSKMKVTVRVEIAESDGFASTFERTVVPMVDGEEHVFADAAEQAAEVAAREVKAAMEAMHGTLPAGHDRVEIRI